MVADKTFIKITKYSIIEKLKELNIINKYHNNICNGVKIIINQSLNDIIEQSIEQNRIIEGQETLNCFYNSILKIKNGKKK